MMILFAPAPQRRGLHHACARSAGVDEGVQTVNSVANASFGHVLGWLQPHRPSLHRVGCSYLVWPGFSDRTQRDGGLGWPTNLYR